MKKRDYTITGLFVLVGFMLTVFSGLAESSNGVRISDSGMRYRDNKNYKSMGRYYSFVGGKYKFTLKLNHTLRKGKKEWYTSIGLNDPSWSGWYGNDFIDLKVSGKSIETSKEPYVIGNILEQGKKGLIEFLFEKGDAQVRMRCLLLPESDHLLVEIMADLSEKGELTIVLKNYPSTFKAFEGKRGRYVKSDGIGWGFKEPKPVLDPKKHYWFFYQDNIFDVGKTPFPKFTWGPSALVVQPQNVKEIVPKIDRGNYQIETTIRFNPGPVRCRFALFEFLNGRNEKAWKQFSGRIKNIVKELDNVSFVPAALCEFNPGKEEERLKQAKGLKESDAESLNLQLENLTKYQNDFLSSEKDKKAAGVIAMEQKYSDAYQKYQIDKAGILRGSGDVSILYFNGMFNELNNIKKGLGKLNKEDPFKLSDYTYTYWAGESLSYFPSRLSEIIQYLLVVIDNVPLSVFEKEHQLLLEEYVKHGGCLIVNGGPWSYIPKDFKGSEFEKFFPVIIDQPFNLKRLSDWQKLQPGKDFSLLKDKVKLQPAPVVLWLHELKLKPKTKVICTIDGKPAIVAGDYGKGKVICILATGLGKNPRNLWDWDKWPDLIKALGEYGVQ